MTGDNDATTDLHENNVIWKKISVLHTMNLDFAKKNRLQVKNVIKNATQNRESVHTYIRRYWYLPQLVNIQTGFDQFVTF